jgi:transposase-like protein
MRKKNQRAVRKNNQPDPDKKAICLKMWKEGAPAVHVAATLEISIGAVYKWTRAAGLSAHQPFYGAEVKAEAIRRVNEGEACKDVARSIGCCLYTLRTWHKKAQRAAAAAGQGVAHA